MKRKQREMVLAGILLVLSLAGCGNSSEKTSQLETTSISEETKVQEIESQSETPAGVEETAFEEEFKPNEYEKALGITKEIKESFIAKYDKDTYDNAVLYNYYILYMKSANRVGDFEADKIGDCIMLPMEVTSSRDSHVIPGDYIIHDEEVKHDIVIILPGIGCHRRTATGAISALFNLGYDVWCMDLPGFGENGSDLSTYGILEQYDLEDVIKYIRETLQVSNPIYLYGYSYGAGVCAVSLQNKTVLSNISAVIMDSPFSSMEAFVRLNLGGYMLNGSNDEEVFGYLNDMERMLLGADMSSANGIDIIKKADIPVLIFTSEADKVIPASEAQQLYDAAKCENKKIVVFGEAKHTDAINSEHDEYVSILQEFLNSIELFAAD